MEALNALSPHDIGAGLLSAGLLAGSGPAHAAMPTLTLDRSAVTDSPVEKVGYYYRRHYYGYRPYYGITTAPIIGTGITATGPTVIMGVAGAIKTGHSQKHSIPIAG
jgi:hypothetical protein